MDAVSANSGSAPSPDRVALWERHGERLVTLCTRVTGSPAAGRRAAARTFSAVIGADPGPLGPRLALAKAALRACEEELGDEAAASAGVVDGAVPAAHGPLAALVARTATANAELPAGDRALLGLRLVSNLTHEQIATLTGDDEERVGERLAGARLALRTRLNGAGAPADGAAPALDGAAPALDGAGPALDGAGPALDGAGPALDGAGPALDGAGPHHDGSRALALLARRQDGERLSDEDSTWLAAHEASGAGCAVARQAMQEADVAYRAWPPEEAGPVPEDVADATTDELAATASEPAAPAAAPVPAVVERRRRRWRR